VAAPPDPNLEGPPVEREEAAFVKAPIGVGIVIAGSQKGIQERQSERIRIPADAAGVQGLAAAEVPGVGSEDIDERPTEKTASSAGAAIAQLTVDVPAAKPRTITAGGPTEGTSRPTDAVIMRAPIAAAPPHKNPEGPPVERDEVAFVKAPIGVGIAIAGSKKEIQERQSERIRIPTDAAGAQGLAAAEVPVVVSEDIAERPTEKTASSAGAAIAQATVDVPATKPRIITAGRPAEGTTRPTDAAIVLAPIVPAPPDKSPEEPPVERTESPAEAAFVKAPIAVGIPIAGSKKEIREWQSEQFGISADAAGVQYPVAEVPGAVSQKNIEKRPNDQAGRLTDATLVRATVAGEVPAAAIQKNSEVRPAERAAGSASTVIMRAPIAAVHAAAPNWGPQEQPVEHPAEAPSVADVRAPVAVDALAATPQQNKENRPTARAARTPEAALARAVDVPAGAPRKRTEEQPVERSASPTYVEVVQSPLAAHAQDNPQERRVELAASPANMPVEQAPVTKGVPLPAPEKTLERSPEKIDITKLGGTLFSRVFGALTEYESDTVRERTNSGLRAGRASGRASGRRNNR
jgi:hypothetical protein